MPSTRRSSAQVRPPVNDPVAARIRARRLALGWSFKRLSEETGGLATSFLFNIENGRKVPGEDVAARIAAALGDGEHEETYLAWARVKSRGRNGRADHEAMQAAWEQLRRGFSDEVATATRAVALPAVATPDASRLRVPVLVSAVDPGDDVWPPAERIVNTLSLDPQLYGHDAARARERFGALRRPFAFPLDPAQAARVPGLPSGYLAVVTREAGDPPVPGAAYVVRAHGRLEVVSGQTLAGLTVPAELRTAGFADTAALRAAVLGRIALLLADVRL